MPWGRLISIVGSIPWQSASATLVNNGGWVDNLPWMKIGKVDLKWQPMYAKNMNRWSGMWEEKFKDSGGTYEGLLIE